MENEELLQLNKKINALTDDLEELKYVVSKKTGSNPNAIKGMIGTLQTALSEERVVITGNDIYLYDGSTGGTSPITGDTATIFFPRTDDETQRFIIRKRAGINFDAENIMELFWEKAADPDTSALETDYKSPASNKSIATLEAYVWTNPTYAYSSNNYYATAEQGASQLFHCWYNFSMFVPSAAIILGITVRLEAKVSGTGLGTATISLSLTKNKNDSIGSGTTAILTSSDAYYILGGDTSLWGDTWVPSDFGTNFGVTMVTGDVSTDPVHTIYSIDNIEIKVRYYFPDTFSRENYIFIGRAGDQVAANSRTDAVSITTNEIFQLEHSSASAPVWAILSSDYSGATDMELWGQGLAGGTRNIFSFKDMGTALVFSDSPSFMVGEIITGNVSGTTAYIGTKTDANNYTAVNINGTFDPATDNACTTNGVAGGSGTGNLSSVTSTEFNPITGEGGGVTALGHQLVIGSTTWFAMQLWIDAYNVWFDSHIKPYTDNAYDIGSANHQVKDIYVGGTIYGAISFSTLLTKGFSASDNLRNSNDASKTTDSATYVKLKEVLLNEDLPTCRIKFYLSRYGTAGQSANGKIYKNGVAIGTERTIGDAATFSEDFTGFAKGDKIQIYCKTTDTWGGISDMRFYYDYNITKIGLETLTTPWEVTEIPISITNNDP